jgi:plastocyanin
MRYLGALIASIVLLAAACGSGPSTAVKAAPTAAGTTASESPTPPTLAVCSPSGTSIRATAVDFTFAQACLAAPANTAFTIRFTNQDYLVVHNLAIYTEDPERPSFPNPNAKLLFKGAFVAGPKTVTYKVSALPLGTYIFRCDVHPFSMFGTFIVS